MAYDISLSDKYQAAEDRFNNILMDILKSIADNKIAGSLSQYYRGIETLLVFSKPYYDNKFNAGFGEISKTYEINAKRIGSENAAKNQYYEDLLDQLIQLIGRSGFLPVRMVDGVIDAEDIERMEDEEDGTIQQEDNGD